MVPETLVIFNQVSWLIAGEDFIKNILNIFDMEIHKTPGKQWEIEYYYFLDWDIM
jgi:hypothetical protein